MRYKDDQKEKTYQRILAAASRRFKKEGYNGIGVDGLAKDAGVTSGAFYGHFKSKLSAFSAALALGLSEVTAAIDGLQKQYGENWWAEFAKFYMSHKRECDLTESCAMQSLTAEVTRSNDEIRKVYEKELLKIIMVASEQNELKTDKAISNLSMLIGGVTLSRAVHDKKLSDQIANAVVKAIGK